MLRGPGNPTLHSTHCTSSGQNLPHPNVQDEQSSKCGTVYKDHCLTLSNHATINHTNENEEQAKNNEEYIQQS